MRIDTLQAALYAVLQKLTEEEKQLRKQQDLVDQLHVDYIAANENLEKAKDHVKELSNTIDNALEIVKYFEVHTKPRILEFKERILSVKSELDQADLVDLDIALSLNDGLGSFCELLECFNENTIDDLDNFLISVENNIGE